MSRPRRSHRPTASSVRPWAPEETYIRRCATSTGPGLRRCPWTSLGSRSTRLERRAVERLASPGSRVPRGGCGLGFSSAALWPRTWCVEVGCLASMSWRIMWPPARCGWYRAARAETALRSGETVMVQVDERLAKCPRNTADRRLDD